MLASSPAAGTLRSKYNYILEQHPVYKTKAPTLAVGAGRWQCSYRQGPPAGTLPTTHPAALEVDRSGSNLLQSPPTPTWDQYHPSGSDVICGDTTAVREGTTRAACCWITCVMTLSQQSCDSIASSYTSVHRKQSHRALSTPGRLMCVMRSRS
jgi:hypothetical protein